MSGEPAKRPVHLRWERYRRALRWGERSGTASGLQLGEYPSVDASALSGRMSLLPPGQGSPTQAHEGDTFFLGVQGQVEVEVGADKKDLGAHDILRIAAGTGYRYVNVGLEHALLFTVRENPAAPARGERPEVDTTDGGPGEYMSWAQNRRSFRWQAPLSDRVGYQRHSGPYVYSRLLGGHMVRMSPGQGSPWHAVPSDLLFVQLLGEVDFSAAGCVWPLEPRDILLLPANTPYIYTNVGLSEVLFFDIAAKRPPGVRNTYYESDPGWPVRSEVAVLDTDY